MDTDDNNAVVSGPDSVQALFDEFQDALQQSAERETEAVRMRYVISTLLHTYCR